MTYVPIVVPTPAPPSPRARELADRLATVLLEYEETHPSITSGEVRQATQLALQRTRAGTAMTAPIIAGALGILLFAGIAAFFFVGGSGAFTGATPFPMLTVIGLIAVAGALIAVLRRAP